VLKSTIGNGTRQLWLEQKIFEARAHNSGELQLLSSLLEVEALAACWCTYIGI